jgi:hypothetical protein
VTDPLLRLLLVSQDNLYILWDALMRHRLMMDIGDPEYDDVVVLLERVGDLLADNIHRSSR